LNGQTFYVGYVVLKSSPVPALVSASNIISLNFLP